MLPTVGRLCDWGFFFFVHGLKALDFVWFFLNCSFGARPLSRQVGIALGFSGYQEASVLKGLSPRIHPGLPIGRAESPTPFFPPRCTGCFGLKISTPASQLGS